VAIIQLLHTPVYRMASLVRHVLPVKIVLQPVVNIKAALRLTGSLKAGIRIR
jgi:hypothetical protein